ncbi:AmmeMemoRadiSam system protein B [Geodermatophilus sp. URMC 64]
MRVRPAAVAGRFYPADPDALAALVDELLGDVPAEEPRARPVAVVAPHAGFQYSGAVAAHAYAQLVPWREEITRVVVLGPAHFVPLDGMAVPGVDAFATPLGPVGIDDDARTVAAGSPDVAVDDAPHAPEHSLETQLPFLQRSLTPDVRVLPVVVGRTPPSAVSDLLARLLEPGAVAVVSTDLSHYLDQRTARERDDRTAAAVFARDASALRPDDACGYWPLCGLLHLAAERDLAVELLRLATSADVGADPRRVVGYGAFLIQRGLSARP